AVGNDKQWQIFCRVAGLAAAAADPRFATNAGRVVHRDEVVATVAAAMKERSTADWQQALEEAGVPCGPIYNLEQVFADPQVQARGMVVEFDHPVAGRVKTVGTPVKLSRTAPQP